MLWISLAGTAIGALNASSEMAIRQFFVSTGTATASELDVLGLISVEPLLRMRQLGDISGVVLIVSVAVIGSSAWKARIGLFLWVSALAVLSRIALIRFLTHWPFSPGDMDVVWTIPVPVILPQGLIIGVAIVSIILAIAVLRWMNGEAKK
jgi:hypothetical protein